MSALVSIIIPIYNLEKYIKHCLESVVNQTYKELEIICIDDGSTDGSAEIIKSMAENDPRIKYIYQENAGVSAARNKGLDTATGEYVMFVDGDDYINLHMVERFVLESKKFGADVVCSDLNIAKDFSKDVISKIDASCCQNISIENLYRYSECGYRVTSALFHHNCINQKKFICNLSNGEDSCFMLEILLASKKIVMIKERYYYCLIRDDSASHNKEYSMKIASLIDAADITCDVIKNFSDSQYDFLKEKFVKGLFITMFINRVESEKTIFKKEVKEKCKHIGKKQAKFLFSINSIPLYEKIAIYTAFKIPFMYKVFRIMSDPSMLRYFIMRQRNELSS